MDPLAGTPYRTVAPIAQGGMGQVVVAEHLELGRTFAVKLILAAHGDDPRLVDRLRVEARILGALNHPNIVGVSGFDLTPGGRPYLVMEHLRGCTLSEHLRAHGKLEIYDAVLVVGQMLDGLQAAHVQGVVHRDVKPSNLFLAETTTGRRVKLIDFGIGKLLPGAQLGQPNYATQEGLMLGTPRYAAPEQIAAKPVDARTDVYAAGLVAYALVAGRGPFDHLTDTRAILLAHLNEAPAPPSHYCPSPLPAELDRVILQALAKQPGDRFASAENMRDALDAVAWRLRAPLSYAETTTWDLSTLRPTRSPAAPDAQPAQPDGAAAQVQIVAQRPAAGAPTPNPGGKPAHPTERPVCRDATSPSPQPGQPAHPVTAPTLLSAGTAQPHSRPDARPHTASGATTLPPLPPPCFVLLALATALGVAALLAALWLVFA